MNFFDNCKIKLLTETATKKIISDDEYFSSKYEQYLSNSSLKLINPVEGGSPDAYFNREKQGYNPSMEFGNAIHAALLQPEHYTISPYDNKPSAKLGKFVECVAKYRKQNYTIEKALEAASDDANYYKGKLSKKIMKTAMEKGFEYYMKLMKNELDVLGKETVVLSKGLKTDVFNCLASLKTSKITKLFNEEGMFSEIHKFYEEAIFVDIEVTLPGEDPIILPFKAKLDNYSIDTDLQVVKLNDLKTSSQNVSYFMGNRVMTTDEDGTSIEKWYNGSFQKYHYYRQAAVYMLILQALLHEQYPKYAYEANMLVVESFGPSYNSEIYPVSNAYITEGIREFKELVCRVAFHQLNGLDAKID